MTSVHCATQRCPRPSRTRNRGQGTLSCCFYILWLLKAQAHRVLSEVKGRRAEIKRGQCLSGRLVLAHGKHCFFFPWAQSLLTWVGHSKLGMAQSIEMAIQQNQLAFWKFLEAMKLVCQVWKKDGSERGALGRPLTSTDGWQLKQLACLWNPSSGPLLALSKSFIFLIYVLWCHCLHVCLY